MAQSIFDMSVFTPLGDEDGDAGGGGTIPTNPILASGVGPTLVRTNMNSAFRALRAGEPGGTYPNTFVCQVLTVKVRL